MDRDVDILVDCAGNQESAVLPRVRRKVSTSAAQRNPQWRTSNDHGVVLLSSAFKHTLDLIPRVGRIVVKHLDRLQRILIQVLTNHFEFAQYPIRRGNDVAANIVRLKDVQQLAWASPKQFNTAKRRDDAHSLSHYRHWIESSIRNSARENGHY